MNDCCSQTKTSRIGIDWSQRTTKLGAVILAAAVISAVLILFGQYEKSAALMTLAGSVVGTLGWAVKDAAGNDKPDQP